jgi:hypothetical protein
MTEQCQCTRRDGSLRTSLAARFEVIEQVKLQKVRANPKHPWSRVGNVRHNVSAWSIPCAMASTWRWVRVLTRPCKTRCPARNAGPCEEGNVI